MKNTTNSRDPLICTVDVVLLTLEEGSLQALLLKREREPFAGALALPGGYVHADADQGCEDAAQRVLQDKAGLRAPYLEQLGCFSGPGRDPRGWSISVAYFAVVPPGSLAVPPGCEWRPVENLPALPFDHARIVDAAAERVRSKSQYSSLPAHLCQEPFTLPQLHAVYQAVIGESINSVSFRRKMDELDFLEAIPGAKSSGGAHRPAQLYRLRAEYRRRLKLGDRGLNT